MADLAQQASQAGGGEVPALIQKPAAQSQESAAQPPALSQEPAAQLLAPSQEPTAQPPAPSQESTAQPPAPIQESAVQPPVPSQELAAQPSVPSQEPEVQPPAPSQEATPVQNVESTIVPEVPEKHDEKSEQPQSNKKEEISGDRVETETMPAESVKECAKPNIASDESKPEVKAESPAPLLPKESGDWQQREGELLKKIDQLEKVENERSEDEVKLELKVREEEIDLLKTRVRSLETELQAALSKPAGKNHEMIENIKQQHEELLSKARGMIFDKTKMVKNQELQIEALTTQVQSLKDINLITKDLLEIRNGEVKAMEDRLAVMEAKFAAEKERYGLVLKRAQTSSNINDDLRKEYETQLKIFKELREKYEQRVQALVAENNRLKAALPPAAPPS